MTEQPELNSVNPTPVEEIEGVVDKTAGKDVKINDSAVGSVSAETNASITNSAVGAVGAGGNISMSNSAAVVIGAGGNVEMSNSGGFALSAGKDMHVKNSSGSLLTCQQAVVENSSISVLLANDARLGEGVKVLMTRAQAIAFGVAFGLTTAVIGYLLKRRR
jgi:hypothetical protein